jgi:O-antigen/teichoic acid export membrane protein
MRQFNTVRGWFDSVFGFAMSFAGAKRSLEGALKRKGFGRNVMTLTGASLAGQLILAFTLPILTRIYSPHEFGIYQAYVTVLGFGLVIAALRYDTAIVLPKSDKTAIDLAVLSLLIVGCFTLLFLICTSALILIARKNLFGGLSLVLSYCLALSFCFGGASQVLNYWALRRRAFVTSGNGRVAQVSSQSMFAVIGGHFHPAAVMLIVGDMGSRFICMCWLGGAALKETAGTLNSLTKAGLNIALRRYLNFSLISSFSSLVNTLTLSLPLLLLIHFYGANTAGLFALADRVLSMPAALITASLSQVYLSEASAIRHTDPCGLRSLYWKLILVQSLMGIGPFLFVAVCSRWGFVWAFGASWREAGLYAQVLSAAYFVGFVSGPVGLTLIVLERQKWQLLWDCGRLLSIVLAMGLARWLGFGVLPSLAIYGIAMAVCYVIHIIVCHQAIYYLERNSLTSRAPA